MLYYFKKILANTKHDATEVFLRVENHSAYTNFSGSKQLLRTPSSGKVREVIAQSLIHAWQI